MKKNPLWIFMFNFQRKGFFLFSWREFHLSRHTVQTHKSKVGSKDKHSTDKCSWLLSSAFLPWKASSKFEALHGVLCPATGPKKNSKQGTKISVWIVIYIHKGRFRIFFLLIWWFLFGTNYFLFCKQARKSRSKRIGRNIK